MLIAAAIILIPELLSGPRRATAPPAAVRAGETPMKTYTIELDRSPDMPAAAPVIQAPAPPVESSTAAPQREPPVATSPTPAAATQSVTPRERPDTRPPTATAPPLGKALSSAAAIPTARQWAVQLGSFANKASAERLAQQWQARGEQAFVIPVSSARGALFRVRLGPFVERAAADATLRKVKASASGAAVVAHP